MLNIRSRNVGASMANCGDCSVGWSDAAGTRFGRRCRGFRMSVTQTTSYLTRISTVANGKLMEKWANYNTLVKMIPCSSSRSRCRSHRHMTHYRLTASHCPIPDQINRVHKPCQRSYNQKHWRLSSEIERNISVTDGNRSYISGNVFARTGSPPPE